MGYTHYYRNKRAFTTAEWKALTEDVKRLIAGCGVPIGNGHGDIGSSPIFTGRHIMFNGIGDDSHETACVTKAALSFEFCKTAHKPYDKVVVEFYKLIRKYDPLVELSSDGGDEVFSDEKKIIVDYKWTYLTGRHNVKVGDTVILPPTPYQKNNWEGVVTGIGSRYSGACKTIVGIKPVEDEATKILEQLLDEKVPSNLSTLEKKIAEYLGYDFSLCEGAANRGAREIMKLVNERLSS